MVLVAKILIVGHRENPRVVRQNEMSLEGVHEAWIDKVIGGRRLLGRSREWSGFVRLLPLAM